MVDKKQLEPFYDLILEFDDGHYFIKPKTIDAIKSAGYFLKNCTDKGPGIYDQNYFYYLVNKDNEFELCIYLDPEQCGDLYIEKFPTNEIRGVNNAVVEVKFHFHLEKLALKLNYNKEKVRLACDMKNLRTIRFSDYDE